VLATGLLNLIDGKDLTMASEAISTGNLDPTTGVQHLDDIPHVIINATTAQCFSGQTKDNSSILLSASLLSKHSLFSEIPEVFSSVPSQRLVFQQLAIVSQKVTSFGHFS